jgi:hypothetical protein
MHTAAVHLDPSTLENMVFLALWMIFLVFALEHLDRGLSGWTDTDVLYSDAEEVLDELTVRLALGREVGPSFAVCDVRLPAGEGLVDDLDLGEAVEIG